MSVLLRIKATLAEETKLRSTWQRYGLLALILMLFVVPGPNPSHNHFARFYIPLMFLLTHLAFAFRWSQPVTIALRVCTLAWILIGGFLLSHIP